MLLQINNKIIIYKQKKSEIISKLEEFNFPKLGIDSNYEYITNIPLFNLTLEKIEEYNKLYDSKQKELDNYMNLTIIDIWKKDLKLLVDNYNKLLI